MYANRLVEETTGYAPEELIGQTPLDLLKPHDGLNPSVCENQDPVAETEDHVELEIRTKSGERRWVATTATTRCFRCAESISRSVGLRR